MCSNIELALTFFKFMIIITITIGMYMSVCKSLYALIAVCLSRVLTFYVQLSSSCLHVFTCVVRLTAAGYHKAIRR